MASGGSQVDVDFFFTACSFDFNAGNGSTTGWAINNLNAVWEVNLVNCHVEQQTQWLQNYGYCNLVACNFTNGTSSGTLGYLINNKIADGFTVHGGTFFNGGSGTVLNTSSLPSLWVGALINGVGGTLASATGIIDPVGNSLFSTLQVTGTLLKYNGLTTAGNGMPAEASSISVTAQAANYNGGSAKTIFTPTAASTIRISLAQYMTQSASSSSTFPSLTIGWTDPGGVARTATVVSTYSGNVTTNGSAQASGVFCVFTNASTPVTITSASYASSGATPMQYCLSVVTEVL
jgi:hypothetical protein